MNKVIKVLFVIPIIMLALFFVASPLVFFALSLTKLLLWVLVPTTLIFTAYLLLLLINKGQS